MAECFEVAPEGAPGEGEVPGLQRRPAEPQPAHRASARSEIRRVNRGFEPRKRLPFRNPTGCYPPSYTQNDSLSFGEPVKMGSGRFFLKQNLGGNSRGVMCLKGTSICLLDGTQRILGMGQPKNGHPTKTTILAGRQNKTSQTTSPQTVSAMKHILVYGKKSENISF